MWLEIEDPGRDGEEVGWWDGLGDVRLDQVVEFGSWVMK